MIQAGDYNLLIIDRLTDFGFFLVDKERTGEVLLPNRYMTDSMAVGDFLEVFVYLDSEDRIVATTEEPLITLGEFAYLQVLEETRYGAFLDWGLPRDLLVPFAEMETPMKKRNFYPVTLFLDEKTQRLAASSKIYRFLKPADSDSFSLNDEVKGFVYEEMEIGFKVVVDSQFRGMIYKNQVFSPLSVGDFITAYVKEIREDGKIDLVLQKAGYEVVEPVAEKILKELKLNNGFLPFHDKTEPEIIKSRFGISKKIFKKAIGKLFKDKIIGLTEKGITLVNQK